MTKSQINMNETLETLYRFDVRAGRYVVNWHHPEATEILEKAYNNLESRRRLELKEIEELRLKEIKEKKNRLRNYKLRQYSLNSKKLVNKKFNLRGKKVINKKLNVQTRSM